MKGGSCTKSPKWGSTAHFFCLACLILTSVSAPTASAWSFPFSIPFLTSPDEGLNIDLELNQILVEYGGSATYTIHLKNLGQEGLTDLSIKDNFGQAGFVARLPAGGSAKFTRTTPPLKAATRLEAVAASKGEEVARAEASVQVEMPTEVFSVPMMEFAKPLAYGDQPLKITAATPKIELAVGADPAAVRPGEKATVRMTVTNRSPKPLRDVAITGPGWTVEVGDINPGESKASTRALTVVEDLSTEVAAAGYTDDGERAADRKSLKISTVIPDLSVTVVSGPEAPGQPTAIEYRLKNEGETDLHRVTLKDGHGATLAILAKLGPGEEKSLTTAARRTEAGGALEVTALSAEGREVIGEVVVAPSARRSSTRSRTSTDPFDTVGFADGLKFQEMDLDLKFDPRFDFGFGDLFGPLPAGGDGAAAGPSAGSKETDTKAETGKSKLVVTLQVNRSLVHKGEMVGYRCTAVNRGTAPLTDLVLGCGEDRATASTLAPGDGIPLEGTMRAEGTVNLTAFASATGFDGSILEDEATLDMEVVSPDLLMEVHKDPEEICRGQRVSIVVRLENTGDDPLSDLRVSDDLGEIGKVPLLGPGEERTLMRDSAIYESLDDEVKVDAVDSTGSRLYRSKILNFRLMEPRMDLTVDPQRRAAYPGETVEVVWTIRNVGEVDLEDVTFVGEAESTFRLPAVAAGGRTQVSTTYSAGESREVTGRAEGRTPGGETVSASAAFEIKVVSPGIGLNVRPSEVEARPQGPFNLTFLVTNTGDDLLRDVTVSEKSLGTLDQIGRLDPGDFRVTTHEFFAETNTTFNLQAEGTDSMGKGWTDSQMVRVKLVSSKIDLSASSDPAKTAPSGTVNLVFTVKNLGDVPIFSTFIMGKTLGHLGTIDYISPGSSRAIEREIEVSQELEEEITAEGFTRDGGSVRDKDILLVGLTVPDPPAEEAAAEIFSKGEDDTKARADPAAGVAGEGYREVSIDGETVTEREAVGSTKRDGDVSGIADLINRLREILEKIRLNDQSSKAAVEARSSEGSAPAGSGPTSTSSAPFEARASTEGSGYGGQDVGVNASPPSTRFALPEGAGYVPSKDLSQDVPGVPAGLEARPAAAGYSYSAEGPSSSYLLSPGTSPKSTGYVYSTSSPAAEYISTPSTAPGRAGYSSSEVGPLSALTSPAGISPTIAVSTTPKDYEDVDPRASSEASPKVAGSEGSAGYSTLQRSREATPGYAEAAAPADTLRQDSPSRSRSPAENIKLVIGDLGELQVDRPPKIIDVGAFPPEPTAWTPVVVAVHATDDIGIKSVDMLWNTPATAVSRLDLAKITKINSQKMVQEDGDHKEGYWSYEIPGQPPGTYMAIFVRVSDGERWAEDGPYILFWSEAAPERGAEESPTQETAAPDGRRPDAVESQKSGMLFVESTTVVGRGDVSIKNEFRESSARYREELDGRGSIEMQSEKTINKGNPVVNITDTRLLVFDQGYLKGFKVMQSPGFHGGMGASVTERFNATTLEKMETGTLSSVNSTQNTLLFNTQQAFEGMWGTRTEYSNFNKKIKADQKLSGTFETQKRITFED